MARRVKAGDLIGIPVPPMGIAVALVLHVSRYFKGSMMIGIFDKLFGEWSAIDLASLPVEFIVTPNYTGVSSVTSGPWRRVGHDQQLLASTPVPELRIGASVYLRDDLARTIPREDFSQYEKVKGWGEKFVEEMIRRYFATSRGPDHANAT